MNPVDDCRAFCDAEEEEVADCASAAVATATPRSAVIDKTRKRFMVTRRFSVSAKTREHSRATNDERYLIVADRMKGP